MRDKKFMLKVASILAVIVISVVFGYIGITIDNSGDNFGSLIFAWRISTLLWIIAVIFCASGIIKFDHPIKKVPSEYDFIVGRFYEVLSSVCLKKQKDGDIDYYLVVVKGRDDNYYTCLVDHPLPAKKFIFAPSCQVDRYRYDPKESLESSAYTSS